MVFASSIYARVTVLNASVHTVFVCEAETIEQAKSRAYFEAVRRWPSQMYDGHSEVTITVEFDRGSYSSGNDVAMRGRAAQQGGNKTDQSAYSYLTE